MDLHNPRVRGTFKEHQHDLLRTIVDCHPLAGHKLAGDDLRARLVADLALERRMREVGIRPVGVGASLVAARRQLGTLLVRMGRRVQGMSGGDLEAQPGLKANSATR